MWSLRRAAPTLGATALAITVAASHPAGAQVIGNGFANNYLYTNQTYGLYLPQVPQPNGQDEIRAADGTTCRSSMASNDAYLDVGGLGGSGADGSFNSGTLYGRVIIPLGGVPSRLDCSSLYQLEIERLRHELELVRAGLGAGPGSAGLASAQTGGGKSWADTGWSNSGWKDGKGASSVGAAKVANSAPANAAALSPPMRLQPKQTASIDVAQATVRAAAAANAAQRQAVMAAEQASGAAAAEQLPWSTEPAQGARVHTAVVPKKQAESGSDRDHFRAPISN